MTTNSHDLCPPVVAKNVEPLELASTVRRRSVTLPSWLVSMIVHMVALIVIGTLTVLCRDAEQRSETGGAAAAGF